MSRERRKLNGKRGVSSWDSGVETGKFREEKIKFHRRKDCGDVDGEITFDDRQWKGSEITESRRRGTEEGVRDIG